MNEAEKTVKAKGITYLEAWTRDDKWVNHWYEKNGFRPVDSYLQVFMEGAKEVGVLESEISNLQPVEAFAHYVGEDTNTIKNTFKRVHECLCYEKKLAPRAMSLS